MTALAQAPTQADLIIAHLNAGKAITPAHAFMVYGISRLAAVVERLRRQGNDIVMALKQDEMGRKYGEYKLGGSIKIGSEVTVKTGHGYDLPRWVLRSKPAKVVGLLGDIAYVKFQNRTSIETIPMNTKELSHVA